jgi:hypothetical protein
VVAGDRQHKPMPRAFSSGRSRGRRRRPRRRSPRRAGAASHRDWRRQRARRSSSSSCRVGPPGVQVRASWRRSHLRPAPDCGSWPGGITSASSAVITPITWMP